jgi:hypothetical protein
LRKTTICVILHISNSNNSVVTSKGCRMADAGEFTSYLGKLMSREAVADLISFQ